MAQASTPSLFDRTVAQLRDVWRDLSLRAWPGGGGNGFRPSLPDDDAARLRQRIAECVASRGGEVSARARAAEIGRAYVSLAPEGRHRFLSILAKDFAAQRDAVDKAIVSYRQAKDTVQIAAAEELLRDALVAPRVRLLKQLTTLPDGFKFLIDLRADLIDHLKDDADLRGLDRDLQELFTSWFDIGLLTLERIAWDSPASLLEKLIAYEAVHEIRSWSDLKNRLDSDRRCFAFFHPSIPVEPLIFVEVALVNGLADDVHKLLDEGAPRVEPGDADTAIFYSISNTQKGLRGISFGDFLIKKVVESLLRDLPHLKNFATLSPIPGFRRWLDSALAAAPATDEPPKKRFGNGNGDVSAAKLRDSLAQPDWAQDTVTAGHLAEPMRRWCARYLCQEKSQGRALDSVARFHLANGARLERINWLADRSPKGLKESYGMMVNYLYRLPDIEANHDAYVGQGQVVASPAIKALLKP
ncbi:MAG: malonyl-CoA decarboxylase [Dongiaceae bacterium]